jgi:hypothetical protein
MEPAIPALWCWNRRISTVLNNHPVPGVLRGTNTHSHYVYETHTQ